MKTNKIIMFKEKRLVFLRDRPSENPDVGDVERGKGPNWFEGDGDKGPDGFERIGRDGPEKGKPGVIGAAVEGMGRLAREDAIAKEELEGDESQARIAEQRAALAEQEAAGKARDGMLAAAVLGTWPPGSVKVADEKPNAKGVEIAAVNANEAVRDGVIKQEGGSLEIGQQ